MANTLQLVLTVDNRPGNESIKQFNVSLSDIERTAAKASAGASQALNSVDQTAIRVAASVKNSFGSLGQVFAGIGLVGLGKAIFNVAADFESARVGIKALVGDADVAKKLFNDIQQFALASPFEFKDLLIGSQRLLAFNFQAKDIVTTLSAVSATVGALGGDTGKVADLITALGQIRNATKLTGEELRQLRNAGVEGIALEGLAKAYGRSVAEIKTAQEDGLIPGLQAADIIIKALEERFSSFNAEVSKTAKTAVSNFKDALQKLADDVARDYLPSITAALNDLRPGLENLGKFVKENASTISAFAGAIGEIGIAIVAYKVVAGIQAITLAVEALTVATLANPWGLVAVGLTLVGIELYKNKKLFDELRQASLDNSQNDFIKQLINGGHTAEELQKIGYSVESIKAALSRNDITPGLDFSDVTRSIGAVVTFGAGTIAEVKANLNKLTQEFLASNKGTLKESENAVGGFVQKLLAAKRIANSQVLDLTKALTDGLKGRDEARKKNAQAEVESARILQGAREKAATGVERIRIDLEGNLALYGKTAKAVKELEEAAQIQVHVELKRIAEERKKIHEKEAEIQAQAAAARATVSAETFLSTIELRRQTSDSTRKFAADEAQFERDARLRSLEAVNAVTLDEKIAVENQKFLIEQEFINKSFAVKVETINNETNVELAKYRALLEAKLITSKEFSDRQDAIIRDGAEKATQLGAATTAEINAARENAAIKSIEIVRENTKSVFSSLKDASGKVFDDLLTKGENVFSSLANALKNGLLTALKEVVSSQVAATLTRLITGESVSFPKGRGSGGILGALGLGIPAFGASNIGPGGTSGFAGPVSLTGALGGLGGLLGAGGEQSTTTLSGIGGTGIGGASGGGGLGSQAGNVLGLGGVLGKGGLTSRLGLGGGGTAGLLGLGASALGLQGAFKLGQNGGLLGKIGAPALGAISGLVGFGSLAYLFPALIAAGPIGWAVAGAIGATVGLIGVLKGKAEDKIVDKVQSIYGVKISRGFAKDPLAGIIKSQFGGNVDVGLRSPQIRELIELYAMTTDQKNFGPNPRKAYPTTFVQASGSLQQTPIYNNGTPFFPAASTLQNAPGSQATPLTIQLDGAATTSLLRGEAVDVASDPRLVGSSLGNANKLSYARRSNAALALTPGTLTA